ncbi:MAG: gluconate 2-dehydrogenase subunit 3 family protein [Acidobacteria bacterium]|nr:gluconate 2-dehydrogenase subunit 3 family protein [Acidobacteriota bacterium]
MSESEIFSRRQFIQLGTLAGVAGWVASETRRILPDVQSLVLANELATNSWRAFTAHQALTVRDFAAEIIPTDEDLGATEVGTVEFIDKLLSLSPGLREHYAAGLSGVDETSRLGFGRPFVELIPERRRKVIQSMVEGSAPQAAWQAVSAKEFFATIRYHTLISYYSNSKVFSSIGFPGPGAYFTTVGEPGSLTSASTHTLGDAGRKED